MKRGGKSVHMPQLRRSRRREPSLLPRKMTRRRRPRGKRSSMRVKIRTLLRKTHSGCETSVCFGQHDQHLILPVYAASPEPIGPLQPRSMQKRRGGSRSVCSENLRPRGLHHSACWGRGERPNRSLPNKTFILRDFFESHELDLILITWLHEGELTPHRELCPPPPRHQLPQMSQLTGEMWASIYCIHVCVFTTIQYVLFCVRVCVCVCARTHTHTHTTIHIKYEHFWPEHICVQSS